ncbi:DNA-binding response regulator [Saccharothrix sp. ALI-22-I]|uniref:response regulator transcription factor n=1 Tax=Saccharothrix sp. ALI-22-I TaxID=1933778 RepID=UPI00097CA144|nr:response regulator transcription factor [Saccharothrix sp. ALI-22-I]ONI90974.1 DNA-binding response regulator [Saccharothrix sp. ALI-22-I]
MRILVTEDDRDLLFAVAVTLRGAGFAVDVAADLATADEALAVNSYDCAVFDRMVPGGDTLAYVRQRRHGGLRVPVLFLTALDSVGHRVEGLEVGDDYLVKPFAMEELVVRVRRLCHRQEVSRPAVLRHADVELDSGTRQVRRAGVLLTLTRREYLVLELLLANAGQPVSRADLIRYAWDEMAQPATNVLDVLMTQLRRKLRQPPLIHTVRQVGYRLA